MTFRFIGPPLILLSAIVLTTMCYWPGLSGGFIFDDTINLKDMGAYGGVVDWETFNAFVLGGWSGPTGRPLSLLSFLIDDNHWPSEASRFKPTNLAIHLICGLLLAWATLLLLRFYGMTERRAQWYAVFTAACWLLHPFLVSTTLYVIQRMSQLAALFVFAGIIGYLNGRRQLAVDPRKAYLWMGFSIFGGTLLAVASKENGVLLPLLIGIIEFCAPRGGQTTHPSRVFRALFIWLPSLVVLGYLAAQINFSPDLWPNRNFNQVERLLTEPRIIWDYLSNFFIPRIETKGIYRDGFVISRELWIPATTFPALFALVALAVAALLLRRRVPLFSLATLFYLAGHLIESTVIGLELYFEHRNYLPSAFLFLPLASSLDLLGKKLGKRTMVVIALLIIALLGFFTYTRAQLWSDTDRLEFFWAGTAIDSPRAQNALAAYYINHGMTDKAKEHLDSAIERFPDSSLLTMSRLLARIRIGQATEQDFMIAADKLVTQPFDAQAVMALRTLVERVVEPDRPSLYRAASLALLDSLSDNAAYKQFPLFVRFIPYLRGQLYLAEGATDQAFANFSETIERHHDIDAALQIVALVANAGYLEDASRLLDQSESIFRQQPDRTLKRSRAIYAQEVARIRQVLSESLVER